MAFIKLKPSLKSTLIKISDINDYQLLMYTPSIIKAFPFKMDNYSFSYRIRCFLEFFCGYRVFYFKSKETWIGYCIVTNGKNIRYKFCDKDDITFGRYYVRDSFRGNGIGRIMVESVLNLPELEYTNAYAYVHDSNKTSSSLLLKIGCKPVRKFNMVGKLRRIKETENGNYTLFCYSQKK